jgi:hypothetical protein
MWLSWLFKIAGSRTARQPHVIYRSDVALLAALLLAPLAALRAAADVV